MAILEILTHPHPLLRRTAAPMPRVDDGVRQLLDDLIETMQHAGGVGLAAMQVGDLRAVVIVDVGRRVREDEASTLLEMVNPVVVEQSGGIVWREGCLSVPGVAAEVERSGRVVVEFLDRSGAIVRHEAEGLEAVAIQHELDHLQGVLYFDRLGALEQKLTLQDYERARSGEARSASAEGET